MPSPSRWWFQCLLRLCVFCECGERQRLPHPRGRRFQCLLRLCVFCEKEIKADPSKVAVVFQCLLRLCVFCEYREITAVESGSQCFSAFSGFVCSARHMQETEAQLHKVTGGVSFSAFSGFVCSASLKMEFPLRKEWNEFQCLLRLCVFCEVILAVLGPAISEVVSVPSQALCVLRGWKDVLSVSGGFRVSVPSQALCVLRVAGVSLNPAAWPRGFSAFSGFVCSASRHTRLPHGAGSAAVH